MLGIGPGIGTKRSMQNAFLKLLERNKNPMVIDADALNILAIYRDKVKKPAGPRILTPHPGELAKLIGKTSEEIQDNRLLAAREAHDSFNNDKQVIIVLKGDGTVIVSDDGYAMINTSGNPGMATGGMGDVLSGVIGSLICQKLSVLEAAGAGVFLHGTAADDLHIDAGYGYTATEVANQIPYTLKRFLQ